MGAITRGICLAAALGIAAAGAAVADVPAVQRTGAGDGQVGRFANPTGAFQLCANAAGSSPSGSYGPDATVFIEMVSGTGSDQFSYDYGNIDITGNYGCQMETLQPGTYTVKVIATDWTNWGVAIYPSTAAQVASTNLSAAYQNFAAGSNTIAAPVTAPAAATVAPSAASVPSASPFGDGTFFVGTDIQAGTYRAPGGGSCYWARLSGFGGTSAETIASDYAQTSPIVTIRPSDAGFQTQSCGTWTPTPFSFGGS